ncbi:MAG: hypothetical protein NTV01_03525, partial [Bacteroidia bacterium]|nr:hypothetical protein [Bacteroidia bacterium]
FFQVLATVVKETLESFNQGLLTSKELKSVGEPPRIEDVTGPDIKIINNRHVFYGAGVYKADGAHVTTFPINRKEKLVSLKLGWPPKFDISAEETYYKLGDGEFDVLLGKGFDFANIFNSNDPVGMGTMMNIGQSLIYVVEIAMGHLPFPDLLKLPGVIKIETKTAFKISDGIIQKKCDKVVLGVLDLLAYNKEEIAKWILGDLRSKRTGPFLLGHGSGTITG